MRCDVDSPNALFGCGQSLWHAVRRHSLESVIYFVLDCLSGSNILACTRPEDPATTFNVAKMKVSK